MARAFRDALGGSPAEAAQGLLEIARTAKRDADRISAWKELLDRGWGKAPTFASIEGADPLKQDEVAAEIRSIAKALEQERTHPYTPRVVVVYAVVDDASRPTSRSRCSSSADAARRQVKGK